ncbi:O-antigen ligase family protein [Hydrogenophaga aromaticivorans]|uniref:O-antigen ligase family protein n=1 Tax=Hydrogenophaga aromaticivorans TaxID=2610898 RepID=UPI001B36ED22|nr:O-antigen ligase family protein [Hydrogenophaga aromaticivorans]MBQ0921632.1 O-antigen ligase family protein [Hydrogenophaga aromaticivorans]
MNLSYKKLALIFFVIYCLFVGADRFTGGILYILLGTLGAALIAKYKLENGGLYILLAALVVFYGALSHLGILRNPWGQYYSDENLARQIIIYLVFILITAASSIIFKRFSTEDFNVNGLMVAGAYIIAAISEYLFIYIHRADEPANPAFIGGLNNAEFIFLALLGAWLIKKNNNLLLGLLTIAFCLAISANSQAYIVLLLLAALLVLKNRRAIVIIYTAALFLFALFCISYPFYFEDYNTVIRALYWRDATKTIFEHNMFFGVGFGGEWIKNWYPSATKLEMFDDGSQEMIHTGLHNSVISIFFRMGFPGLIIALFLIYHLLKKSFSSKLKSYLFILIVTSLWVNVALESPLFNVSIALAWGYIVSATQKNINLRSGVK